MVFSFSLSLNSSIFIFSEKIEQEQESLLDACKSVECLEALHQINNNTNNIFLKEEEMDGKDANNNHSVDTNKIDGSLETMKDSRFVDVDLILLQWFLVGI